MALIGSISFKTGYVYVSVVLTAYHPSSSRFSVLNFGVDSTRRGVSDFLCVGCFGVAVADDRLSGFLCSVLLLLRQIKSCDDCARSVPKL